MANKVMYGVSNLHVGTYTVGTTGTVTLGTPMKIPGTVNISLEPSSEETKFYADNVVYWAGYSDNGYTGEIENALFPDTFKTSYLNYVSLGTGGIAHLKGANSTKTYIMFQAEGDDKARRCIMYNCTFGQITREYATVEDSEQPQTAKLPFTCSGDQGTGIIKAVYEEGASAYNTMFSSPPVPALPGA